MSDTDTADTDQSTAPDDAHAPPSAAESGAESATPSGASRAESLRVAAAADVPPGADTNDCGRCGRPFAREELLVLHRGLAHYGDLTDAEREAFRTAYDDETADIRRFRIAALGGLVLLYFGFLLAYAVFA